MDYSWPGSIDEQEIDYIRPGTKVAITVVAVAGGARGLVHRELYFFNSPLNVPEWPLRRSRHKLPNLPLHPRSRKCHCLNGLPGVYSHKQTRGGNNNEWPWILVLHEAPCSRRQGWVSKLRQAWTLPILRGCGAGVGEDQEPQPKMGQWLVLERRHSQGLTRPCATGIEHNQAGTRAINSVLIAPTTNGRQIKRSFQ